MFSKHRMVIAVPREDGDSQMAKVYQRIAKELETRSKVRGLSGAYILEALVAFELRRMKGMGEAKRDVPVKNLVPVATAYVPDAVDAPLAHDLPIADHLQRVEQKLDAVEQKKIDTPVQKKETVVQAEQELDSSSAVQNRVSEQDVLQAQPVSELRSLPEPEPAAVADKPAMAATEFPMAKDMFPGEKRAKRPDFSQFSIGG